MFGHPKGLKTLFFTEMWERLSYYGMRALLVLFLVDEMENGGFGMTAKKAGAIYGLYTASVYLAGLPGGWIADRILGLRRSVFWGGCVIASGHFCMALPTEATFFVGLALIVVGTGLLKPNVSAIVGDLYPEGGARRDAGFSIYYMGINVGALIGPLICGWLGENVAWHYGFTAAGVGMVFGVIQYRLGEPALGTAGDREIDPAQRKAAVRQTLLWGAAAAGLIAAVALGGVQITAEAAAEKAGVVIVAIAALYFSGLLILGDFSLTEKKRIGVIIILFFSSAVFWSGFEQAGSSMNLFAEEKTDLSYGAPRASGDDGEPPTRREIPASWLQSVNPFFIILLAPVFGALWVRLGSRQPSMPAKFAYALALLAIGFLVLAWGATYAQGDAKVSPAWLIVAYFFHTSGELCLSPVGLSSVTKLAPKRLVGQMMGVWFTGTALGNLLAGLFGGLFDSLPLPRLFGAVAAFAGFAGVLMAVSARPIKKMMGDIK